MYKHVCIHVHVHVHCYILDCLMVNPSKHSTYVTQKSYHFYASDYLHLCG